jgi:transglutaminase superfamily protein
MRRGHSRTRAQAGFWGFCLAIVGAAATAGAGNLNDLFDQKDLTPEALARVIADFSFELDPQLQEPETFLQRKRGDCADFANLASLVLTHRGYTTKLVVVMMSKQTHVVCYVKEAGGFLDFNHRADTHPVIASDGSLEDIAGKVAGDFRSQWHMASAFRYRERSPVYLDSVFAAVGRAVKNRAAKATRTAPAASTAGPAEASAAPVAFRAMIN